MPAAFMQKHIDKVRYMEIDLDFRFSRRQSMNSACVNLVAWFCHVFCGFERTKHSATSVGCLCDYCDYKWIIDTTFHRGIRLDPAEFDRLLQEKINSTTI